MFTACMYFYWTYDFWVRKTPEYKIHMVRERFQGNGISKAFHVQKVASRHFIHLSSLEKHVKMDIKYSSKHAENNKTW